jgi:ribonuclease P protein component
MKRSLTRSERLRSSRDIKAMFSSAKRLESQGLKMLVHGNGLEMNRVAVMVSRGCGGSVRRNREKRVTREAYRELKPGLKSGNDILFIIGRFGQSVSERQYVMRILFLRADLRDQMD